MLLLGRRDITCNKMTRRRADTTFLVFGDHNTLFSITFQSLCFIDLKQLAASLANYHLFVPHRGHGEGPSKQDDLPKQKQASKIVHKHDVAMPELVRWR